MGDFYTQLLKPVLFKCNPELVHTSVVRIGEGLGKCGPAKKLLHQKLVHPSPLISQNLLGHFFASPFGLSAGFDYEARLTQILPALGFGFTTVGTITNLPYGGNAGPMLGRLPKSKALMVNKGFKNLGADKTISRLSGLTFEVPVGISIGRTNSIALATQAQSITDIAFAFTKFEGSLVKHTHYELNISCPNLVGSVTFYPPKNLEELLRVVDGLQLSRPLLVKMPIEKSDKEVLAMLAVISEHRVAGVIFGNLQKDRSHPSLFPDEVAKFPKGNFSGKPTYDRSNELISLAYKHYSGRLLIVGCGGVFTTEDAVEKIRRGASLVQLITGLIYKGPQLVSQMNKELALYIKRAGYKSITELVGTKHS